MPNRDHYAAGTPSWVDLMSPDVDASTAFYTGLFGWEAEDQHDDQGTRIYTMFRKDGRDVAGLGGQMPGTEGMPPTWNTYVATDDADATVARVESAGGKVVMPTMQVMDSGRMAVLADPGGAVISVWEAGEHHGAGVVNEPGAFSWNELMTRSMSAVRPFYEQVFDWQLVDQDMGPMGTYTVATLDGEHSIAGMMGTPPSVPAEVPDYWLVYFTVADVDATAARAEELGGTVASAPFDIPGVGRVATILDPQGGAFSLMQPEAS